jgi:hypothetical protein
MDFYYLADENPPLVCILICNFFQCPFTQCTECGGWNPRYHSKKTGGIVFKQLEMDTASEQD